jgi:hypothetical protein
MSTWTSECPVEGGCSECGYAFQWKHLLGPNLGVPKWFFETARRRVIRAAISTSMRTLMPWHFWRRVPLHAPVRIARLLTLGVSAVIVLYLASVACVALPGFVSAYDGQEDHLMTLTNGLWIDLPKLSTRPERLAAYVNFLPAYARWPESIGTSDWMGKKLRVIPVVLLGTALVGPCIWVLGQFTERRVRVCDVVRASVYVIAATAVAFVLLDVLIGAMLFRQVRQGDYIWWQLEDTHDLLVRRGSIVWAMFMVAWWWCCTRFHYGMRRAILIAVGACTVAFMAAGCLLFPITAPETTWSTLIRW